MNKNKTKVIWIVKQKHSKDKLSVDVNLDWGTIQFYLLGLRFPVNLDKMTTLNYSLAFEKAKKLLQSWKWRPLTPIGRITVIKTFILSKFVHLFTTIPSPDHQLIKETNSLLSGYMRNQKPDKIKRSIIIQYFNKGGLRMLDLQCFIQSLKVTWMSRLFKSTSSSWIDIFEQWVCPIYKITKFGPTCCKHVTNAITNKFWIEVLQTWADFCDKTPLKTENDVLVSPLWYNFSKSYSFQHGSKKVKCVGDIIDRTVNSLIVTVWRKIQYKTIKCFRDL